MESRLNSIGRINTEFSSVLVQTLAELGVSRLAMCPGSRLTPLVAAADRHKQVQVDTFYDERVMGFYGLGFGKALGLPLPIMVTSGTALANLMPAVCEANALQVPMLILSADRPHRALNCGANQTMDQENFFGSFARGCLSIPVLESVNSFQWVASQISELFSKSIGENPGPIHINCRFKKPLEPVESKDKMSQFFVPKYFMAEKEISFAAEESFLSLVKEAKKGIILVGGEQVEATLIKRLSEKLNWPVYADVSSSMKASFDEWELYHYKHAIEVIKNDCDCVLQFGGRFIFYELTQAVKNVSAKHIYFGETGQNLDQDYSQSVKIFGEKRKALSRVIKQTPFRTPDSINLGVLEKDRILSSNSEQSLYLQNDITEQSATAWVIKNLSADHSLFVSNSTAIRCADKFYPRGKRVKNISSSRGLSGIDGLISTAAGLFNGRQSCGVLLIGDQAFIHDSNGLECLKYLPKQMLIVVLNNGGCGIFSTLPISKHKALHDKYFYMPHHVELKKLSEAFGISHVQVLDLSGLKEAFASGLASCEHRVIEVVIDPNNKKPHEKLMEIGKRI